MWFPFVSLLGRLIIMQLRFFYLLVWLRAVFCRGFVHWLPSGAGEHSRQVWQITSCAWVCYNRFVYNIEHYCLYSVCLETSLFTCRATALMIQCCCIKPSAWGHVPPALSSMKHMQSPGEDWLHKNAFGVQISLHITQNYRALLWPLEALVWHRVTSLSSGARAGYDVDSPA